MGCGEKTSFEPFLLPFAIRFFHFFIHFRSFHTSPFRINGITFCIDARRLKHRMRLLFFLNQSSWQWHSNRHLARRNSVRLSEMVRLISRILSSRSRLKDVEVKIRNGPRIKLNRRRQTEEVSRKKSEVRRRFPVCR